MSIKSLFILFLLLLGTFSCKSENKSSVKGWESLVFGKKQVFFPDAGEEQHWTSDITAEEKQAYHSRKFTVGSKIGEGAYGKVYNIKDDFNLVI